jgi:hypothetical protein
LPSCHHVLAWHGLVANLLMAMADVHTPCGNEDMPTACWPFFSLLCPRHGRRC